MTETHDTNSLQVPQKTPPENLEDPSKEPTEPQTPDSQQALWRAYIVQQARRRCPECGDDQAPVY